MAWDFFLAHASADSEIAERLRSLLEPESTVFEDSMLHAGEDWDVALDRHLRASAITVVLISGGTEASQYQREEITRAVALARGDSTRRVVPLLLADVEPAALPYGLAVKTCVRLSDGLDLAAAAQILLASLRDLRQAHPPGPREAASEIVGLLLALDLAALQRGESSVLHAAVRDVRGGAALLNHLRRRGLDPRVVLPSLPDHAEATHRWSMGADNVSGAPELPQAVRRQLVRSLIDDRRELTAAAAAARREVLTGPATSWDALRLVTAIASVLPPLRSASTEVVSAGSTELAAQREPRAILYRTAVAMTELPAPDPMLVGRERLVADVVSRLGAAAARGSATAFLTGSLGTGVSSVALEVARGLKESFSGGVRYVDLRGLDEDSRREAADVAKLVCHSLGETPNTGSELEQYRAVLDGRGVLLVLDNALDARHVARLVPAPRTCAIIVTSRNRTQGYADAGLVVHVPPLARSDAVAMLSSLRGDDGDGSALARIAEACADLPMALRLISVWITNHPETTLPSIARQLAAEKARLQYLDDGVLAMRAAIALSYGQLDEEARRAFRFLPAVPGSAATSVELGRGLDHDPDLMELILYRLVDRSVAGCEEQHWPDLPLFRLFELVRLYALERLEQEEPPELVARFRRLLVTAVLDEVRAEREPDPTLRLDPTPLIAARSVAEREEWFDVAADLTEGLRALHEAESDDEAVRRDRRRAAELRELDGDVEGAIRDYLALAGDLAGPEAEEVFVKAEDLAERAALHKLVGEVAFERVKRHHGRHEYDEALAAGERAFNALLRAGLSTTAIPVALNNIKAAMQLDRDVARLWLDRTETLVDARTPVELRASLAWLRASLSPAAHAVELWRDASRLQLETDSFANAGLACLLGAQAAVGRSSLAEAAELFLIAADHCRRAGDANRELWALIGLSAAYAEVGQLTRAREVVLPLQRRALRGNLWHPGAAAELALRVAVLDYLIDGTIPNLDLLPAIREESPETDATAALAEVTAALRHPQAGQATLRAFAETPFLNRPPPHDPWIHTELGEEIPKPPQLT